MTYETKKQRRSGSSQSFCSAYVRRLQAHGSIFRSATCSRMPIFTALTSCGLLAGPTTRRKTRSGDQAHVAASGRRRILIQQNNIELGREIVCETSLFVCASPCSLNKAVHFASLTKGSLAFSFPASNGILRFPTCSFAFINIRNRPSSAAWRATDYERARHFPELRCCDGIDDLLRVALSSTFYPGRALNLRLI
jgi:hypothetical protein